MEHQDSSRFWTGYSHAVHDYLVDRVRNVHEERRKHLRSIRNRPQAVEYQSRVRAAIRRAFSPFPERTPLNAKTTGILLRPGYRVEKVLFESRPGCPVTANLYLPSRGAQPFPAVLGSCGHSRDGKAADRYQEFCQRLVRAGFAVLLYDPFDQEGERGQYIHLPAEAPLRADCCAAHNMIGKKLELAGGFFGSWRAWDGIRAFDYLLERPEVDRRRVGMTGNSGGGTMTTWIRALEKRLSMAAPGCFVTTFLRNLENELPADSEQYPPGVLGAGLEMADFFIARAPDPVILLCRKYDYFDRRGLLEAYEEVKRFYGMFGRSDAVQLFLGNNPHGYHEDTQTAMVSFFCRQSGIAPVRRQCSIRQEKEEDLFAAREGRALLEGGEPVFLLVERESRFLTATPGRLSRETVRRRVRRLLCLPRYDRVPPYRNLPSQMRDGKAVARYAVETEPHVITILRKLVCDPGRRCVLEVEKEICLHLPHVASETDIELLIGRNPEAASGPLYFLDVRGLGESMPRMDSRGFFDPYGMDYMFHGYHVLLGESYLGRRALDLLLTANLLVHEGTSEIVLHGRGQGALIALFGGLLHPRVRHVVMENGPLSCREWMKEPDVAWPHANFVRGILKMMDLPDVMKVLGKRLSLVEPWGADMRPLPREDVLRTLNEAGLPEDSLCSSKRGDGSEKNGKGDGR